MRSHQKVYLRQRLQHFLLKRLRSFFPKLKTFHFLVSLEVADPCFSQSALRLFAFRLCRFPVLKPEVVTLLLLSHPCFAYGMSNWCKEMERGALFQTTMVSKSVCMFFLRTWVLRKTQLYRTSSSYVLRAIRLLSGFAVAL